MSVFSSNSQLRRSTSSSIAKSTISAFHKKQKMTLTQTYYLAHTARAKLSREASRADHDLRLLVGHANLLDGLMLDLADAEREQESWFNQTVSNASAGLSSSTSSTTENKHIRFAESLPAVSEDYELGSSDEESEADEDSDDEFIPPIPQRRAPSPPTLTTHITTTTTEMDLDEDGDDDEYDDETDEDLHLTRTSSHTPPDLSHESDSDSSDDDSMPPSPPPRPEIPLDAFSAKQKQAALHTSSSRAQSSSAIVRQEDGFYETGYYLPQRQPVVVY